MTKLRGKIQDRTLLVLIHRYLTAPIAEGQQRQSNRLGVPQGGPLSPLLANIVLNELDWELTRRGHRFARYADDFIILVKSQQAGQRVMNNIQRYLRDTLKLTVNTRKSAVGRPWKRQFLGFTFTRGKGYRLKVSDSSLAKLKANVRLLSRRTRGQTIYRIISDVKKALLGWKAYFDIAQVLSPLKDIDKWIRRRLRCYLLKQWGRSGYRMLRQRGVSRQLAWNTAKSGKGPWRLSNSPALYQALPTRYFMTLGLPLLAAR
jgi:group II intron reverse transcriptase/maturase